MSGTNILNIKDFHYHADGNLSELKSENWLLKQQIEEVTRQRDDLRHENVRITQVNQNHIYLLRGVAKENAGPGPTTWNEKYKITHQVVEEFSPMLPAKREAVDK